VTVARPLPQARGEEKDYYADLREHRMPYYLCSTGEHVYARPQEFCPACGAAVMRQWSSGEGIVYSYTTLERAGHPYFADAVPYVIALVEFGEGFRSLADLTLPPGLDVPSIGQRVRVEYEDVTDDMTLAHFVAVA
jgi:uncharacterized OB-fold protein